VRVGADFEFYDISADATRRFLQAKTKKKTREGKFPIIH